jgi:hypothetical protein
LVAAAAAAAVGEPDEDAVYEFERLFGERCGVTPRICCNDESVRKDASLGRGEMRILRSSERMLWGVRERLGTPGMSARKLSATSMRKFGTNVPPSSDSSVETLRRPP